MLITPFDLSSQLAKTHITSLGDRRIKPDQLTRLIRHAVALESEAREARELRKENLRLKARLLESHRQQVRADERAALMEAEISDHRQRVEDRSAATVWLAQNAAEAK